MLLSDIKEFYSYIQSSYSTAKDLNTKGVDMWHKAVGHLSFDIALRALELYFINETGSYPKPADILRYAGWAMQEHNHNQAEKESVQCEICGGEGWFMLEKEFSGRYYNTVYNCTCRNERIPKATDYIEAGISLGAYEQDYAGRFMSRRSL